MLKLLRRMFKPDNQSSKSPSSQTSSSQSSPLNLSEGTGELLPKSAEIKEISRFARKNNIIEEFHDLSPRVSSSNLSAWEGKKWTMEQEYMGFMLTGNTEKEIMEQMMRVSQGDIKGLMTIEQYNKKFGPTDPNHYGEEPTFNDDVDLIPDLHKPTIPTSTTYQVSGFPNQNKQIDNE